MNITLRDYQESLCSGIFDSLAANRRIMAQLPAGGGKTICFSYAIHKFIKLGANVLVLAHRQELLTQASDKLQTITGLLVGLVKAGIRPDYSAPIQVASVQSLVNRLDAIAPPDLIIVDEAHHATANSYVKVIEHYPLAAPWCHGYPYPV